MPFVHYSNVLFRESFDNIYLDLSKQPGKCKLAESGLGWKPSGGGETFTLDSSNVGAAQWSRAAKGFELKILSRSSGVIQLDGFDQEVRPLLYVYEYGCLTLVRLLSGFRAIKQGLQDLVWNKRGK